MREWINTTFPVAPGAGSHTFHNLARSASGSPFFARHGMASQAVNCHSLHITHDWFKAAGSGLCRKNLKRLCIVQGYVPARCLAAWTAKTVQLQPSVKSKLLLLCAAACRTTVQTKILTW